MVVVAGTKRGWDRLQGDSHTQLLALKQGGLPSLCQVSAALTCYSSPACPGDDLLSVFCFNVVLVVVNTDAVVCNVPTV